MTFHLLGAAAEALGDATVTLPGDASPAWVNAKFPHGQGSGFARVICSDLDEQVETKPNSTPKNANRVTIPTAITGRFTTAGELAYFELQAKEGERLSIQGQTRAIGSRAALSLQLLDAESRIVAESKADGPEDGAILATIPASGVYRVVARELAGAAGPGMFYRLEIREVTPGFSLSVETDAVNAVAGQSFKMKVTASRRNYTGPIALSLIGDASGFPLKPSVIPAGKSEVELEVTVPLVKPQVQPLQFRIIGKATVDKVEVVEGASTLIALKKLFPRPRSAASRSSPGITTTPIHTWLSASRITCVCWRWMSTAGPPTLPALTMKIIAGTFSARSRIT